MERWALLRDGKRGHKWLAWFTDLDRSGVSIDRPALNDARDLAVEHRAAIVVFDLATYSRLVPEGLSALERLAAEEVTVISASEDLDATPPEGELSPTMFLAMSQHQVRRIGASWRNVIDRNKREGWWHGVVPYGYRRPTAKEAAEIGRRAGVIVPDETTAPHVRELSRRYLEGESWYALGILAVERGWFSRGATAKDILTNAVADLASGLRTEARDRAERELRAERKGRAEDREALLDRRTKLNRAAASRLMADVDDALSTEEIDAALGVLRAELQQVESRLTPDEELAHAFRHELEAALDRAEDLASLWPDMTNDERVEALRSLGAVVVIAPTSARRSPVAGRVTLRVPWLPEQQAG